jgi:hypothetical protein
LWKRRCWLCGSIGIAYIETNVMTTICAFSRIVAPCMLVISVVAQCSFCRLTCSFLFHTQSVPCQLDLCCYLTFKTTSYVSHHVSLTRECQRSSRLLSALASAVPQLRRLNVSGSLPTLILLTFSHMTIIHLCLSSIASHNAGSRALAWEALGGFQGLRSCGGQARVKGWVMTVDVGTCNLPDP